MEHLDIYRCSICGNIVQILNSGAGELICCGQPMEKLVPSVSEEAMIEKHGPIFIGIDENTEEIRVGEVLHPMIDTHYIMFIEAFNDDKSEMHLKFLKPNDEPKLTVCKNKYNKSIEYCNIHGLWEGSNND